MVLWTIIILPICDILGDLKVQLELAPKLLLGGLQLLLRSLLLILVLLNFISHSLVEFFKSLEINCTL